MLRAAALYTALAATASAKPMADLIDQLPGWDAPLPSHHFSGCASSCPLPLHLRLRCQLAETEC